MSSKNAMYESSMLCGFGAADVLADSGFTAAGVTCLGVEAKLAADVFGFGFRAADSLLTRTDAGTMDVSSGVC